MAFLPWTTIQSLLGPMVNLDSNISQSPWKHVSTSRDDVVSNILVCDLPGVRGSEWAIPVERANLCVGRVVEIK